MNGFVMMLVGIVIGLIGAASVYVADDFLESAVGAKKIVPWLAVLLSGVVLLLAAICMAVVGAIRFFQYLWAVTA